MTEKIQGIKVKPGVCFHPDTIMEPMFWWMAAEAQHQAPIGEGYFITITSGCDGIHSERSKHYDGWAIDIRIRDFPGIIWKKKKGVLTLIDGRYVLERWAKAIQNALGNRYTVILELGKYHIHIQYNHGA